MQCCGVFGMVVVHRSELLQQAGVIGALVGAASPRTTTTNGIDSVTLHLAVATGKARQHLTLLAWPLFSRAFRRMRARLGAVRRHDGSSLYYRTRRRNKTTTGRGMRGRAASQVGSDMALMGADMADMGASAR